MMQPEYPYFYSLPGFQYCNLLLFQGKHEEVLKRSITVLKSFKEKGYPLLSIALDNLSIGKALLLQAIQIKSTNISDAEKYLNKAIDGLRESGYQYYLPLGLLARAALYHYKQDFAQAWLDLDEAREIAEYGGMRLHLTDYYLEACRVIREEVHAKARSAQRRKGVGEDFGIVENGEHLLLSKADIEAKFKDFLSRAKKLIGETGYHLRDKEFADLEKEEFLSEHTEITEK
jgi:hypothetical protein